MVIKREVRPNCHYQVQKISSVQLLSHVQLFETPWTAACQASLIYHQLLKLTQTHPLSSWCHPTISSSVVPFFSHLQSLPASGSLLVSRLFTSQVAKVLEFQLQYQSYQWTPRTDLLKDGLVGSPCSPRDSQESSPIPQFKSTNSLALCFLYSPTLTSVHNCWKNLSFD